MYRIWRKEAHDSHEGWRNFNEDPPGEHGRIHDILRVYRANMRSVQLLASVGKHLQGCVHFLGKVFDPILIGTEQPTPTNDRKTWRARSDPVRDLDTEDGRNLLRTAWD